MSKDEKFSFDDWFPKLPEGIYVDKEAMTKETIKTVEEILQQTVTNIKEQTMLVDTIDKEYAKCGVSQFIREQAAQRLGDVLLDITIAPIIQKILCIYEDPSLGEPHIY